MYWQDKPQTEKNRAPDDVVDLSFRIRCPHLPLDHAWALSRAVVRALPWLEDETRTGIHLIHGAESGNGWFRPEDSETELLYLSRRTRFQLRLPKKRLDDALALCGSSLDVEGHTLELGDANVRPLGLQTTIFARYVLGETAQEEEHFVEQIVDEMQQRGIAVRKLLCGRRHRFRTPDGDLFTRSVMLADLERADSILLQQQGLGAGRLLGMGLFMPHKDINPVNKEE